MLKKLLATSIMLVCMTPILADNLYVRAKHVTISELTVGIDYIGFTVNEPEMLPVTCDHNQIIFSAAVPLSRMTSNLLGDVEQNQSRLEYIEYQLGPDGVCHLTSWEKEITDPLEPWSLDNLTLLDTFYVDANGIARLAAIGCPNPFIYPQDTMTWQVGPSGSSFQGKMRQELGDLCVSDNRESMNNPDNWSFFWRIYHHQNNVYTDWVEVP